MSVYAIILNEPNKDAWRVLGGKVARTKFCLDLKIKNQNRAA